MRFVGLCVLLVATTAVADPDPESRTAIDFIGGAHVLANGGDDSGLHVGGGAALRIHDLLPTHRLDIELGWERTRVHGDDEDFSRFDRFRFLVGTGFDLGNDFDLCIGGGIEVLDATRVVPTSSPGAVEGYSTSFRAYAPLVSGSVSRFVDLGMVRLGAELVTRVSGHDAPTHATSGFPFSYTGADVELRFILRL
ncbi:MAG TPA: hypothetical protein VGM39_21650 [Kofleriaceae bacterium]|jgi:hypothetical protein